MKIMTGRKNMRKEVNMVNGVELRKKKAPPHLEAE